MIEAILILLAVTVGVLAAIVLRMYALVLLIHQRTDEQHELLVYLLSEDEEEPEPSLDEPSIFPVTFYLN